MKLTEIAISPRIPRFTIRRAIHLSAGAVVLSVAWFRGKDEVSADDRVHFGADNSSLEIVSTQAADSGKYTAVATDEGGEAIWVFTLSVLSSSALGINLKSLLKVSLLGRKITKDEKG